MRHETIKLWEKGGLCLVLQANFRPEPNGGEGYDLSGWEVKVYARPTQNNGGILVLDMDADQVAANKWKYQTVTEAEFEQIVLLVNAKPWTWDRSGAYMLTGVDGLDWQTIEGTSNPIDACFLINGTNWRCIQVNCQLVIPPDEWGQLGLPADVLQIIGNVAREDVAMAADYAEWEEEELRCTEARDNMEAAAKAFAQRFYQEHVSRLDPQARALLVAEISKAQSAYGEQEAIVLSSVVPPEWQELEEFDVHRTDSYLWIGDFVDELDELLGGGN